MAPCVVIEAKAAPRTPSSGIPRLPKMNTQLTPALTTAPASVTQSSTRARPSALR